MATQKQGRVPNNLVYSSKFDSALNLKYAERFQRDAVQGKETHDLVRFKLIPTCNINHVMTAKIDVKVIGYLLDHYLYSITFKDNRSDLDQLIAISESVVRIHEDHLLSNTSQSYSREIVDLRDQYEKDRNLTRF